jgi:methylphosphotriester-DNA--protein-cysteine methyltransferase
MSMPSGEKTAKAQVYMTDEQRWDAVERRECSAAGHFFTAVRTTGVYCKPGCPARMPLRKNVEFYPSCESAERAGYRACKRCKPDSIPPNSIL